MTTKPVGLCVGIESRDATLTVDAAIVNGYCEKVSESNNTVIKRSGLGNGVVYPVAPAQGLVNYLGNIFVVINNTVYTSSTQSFVIASGNQQVDFG